MTLDRVSPPFRASMRFKEMPEGPRAPGGMTTFPRLFCEAGLHGFAVFMGRSGSLLLNNHSFPFLDDHTPRDEGQTNPNEPGGAAAAEPPKAGHWPAQAAPTRPAREERGQAAKGGEAPAEGQGEARPEAPGGGEGGPAKRDGGSGRPERSEGRSEARPERAQADPPPPGERRGHDGEREAAEGADRTPEGPRAPAGAASGGRNGPPPSDGRRGSPEARRGPPTQARAGRGQAAKGGEAPGGEAARGRT